MRELFHKKVLSSVSRPKIEICATVCRIEKKRNSCDEVVAKITRYCIGLYAVYFFRYFTVFAP